MTIHVLRPAPAGGFSDVLAAARRGDAAAVAQLYARYSPRIIRAIRSRLPPALRRKYDTTDFVHSVFVEVLRNLPRIEDRGEGAFVRLLTMKAVSKVRMKLRHHLGPDGHRAEERLATGEERGAAAADALAAIGSIEDDVKLHALLAGLDATTRDVLRMRSEGRSFARIASALGLATADATRKRYARALADLRHKWERGTN